MATNCPSHRIWSLFSCSGFDLQSEQGRANHCAIEPPLFKAVVMIALSGNPLSTPTACCVIVLLMCTYLSIKCTLLAHKVGFIVRFLFYFIFWRLESRMWQKPWNIWVRCFCSDSWHLFSVFLPGSSSHGFPHDHTASACVWNGKHAHINIFPHMPGGALS